jgi:hypothetical protein
LISVTGTAMAADQVRGLDRGLRSRGWLPAQGRILGATTLRVRSPVGWFSSPAVAYEYTVNGETYQAQTINYRGSVSLVAAVRTVQRYRSGRQVTVYYDPEHPHIAVLERGATFGGLVRVVLSALLVWVGLRVFYGGAA